MAYEIATPGLGKVIERAWATADAVKDGSIDRADARVQLQACTVVTRAHEIDLKLRLNAPKLAKLVSHSEQAKLASS